MPVLLRAAHVEDVPEGTSRVVTLRGAKVRVVHVGGAFAAFDADAAPMAPTVGPADLTWARQQGATEYRVVVRGTYVHVGLDAARETAGASVQATAGPPAPRR
ncbi:MAG: hypothetical protein IT460_14725 [Planctomycetes bacterium]|nr:hypothetical protein [Planctomycetota bacterium]